ncbi:MAG: STAS domain-containing protein [Thiobacillus sp.]|uniref:STAS domain-containing protein n=1 Tax=Thiobacillus sp. TaxID=924 RepID=UPI002895496E|nr:STAS domain-containing protein [Thiobacillus sp.]MDT3707316.1 STAS domain-containing protein [Thiobacillus sp.]
MTQSPARTVALPAIVDLDALDSVRDQLIDAVESGPVRVVGGEVERVSTNALLMLISAAESARRSNFAFEVVGPSAPMLAAIERLGLSESFAEIARGIEA